MRKVIDTNEVAHYWANQRQEEAKNAGGNFYFHGKTIYSYGSHFPIATLMDNGVCLFTTRSYSNTTAKHINNARSAASHKTLIYCNDPKEAATGKHETNIKDFEAAAKLAAQQITPKTRKPENYLQKIAYQRQLFTTYCEYFKLNIDKIKKQYALVYLFIESRDGSETATETERIANEKAAKLAERRRKVEFKKQNEQELKDLLKWRKFGKGYTQARNIYFRTLENTFLRYNTDSEKVETSKGIEIPVKVAERFYKWLIKTLNNGGCDGNCKHEIAGYEVSTVNKDGFIIGCHNITWAEADKLASKLNWK